MPQPAASKAGAAKSVAEHAADARKNAKTAAQPKASGSLVDAFTSSTSAGVRAAASLPEGIDQPSSRPTSNSVVAGHV